MVLAGKATNRVGIADLAFHLSPALLLDLKLIRLNTLNKAE